VKTLRVLSCIIILSLFLISSIGSALASFLPEEFKRDFTPVSGYAIGIDGYKVILDIGSNKGVKPGDIFTVYEQGNKIIDPKTGKTLGFRFFPIAWIEVFSVEDDFSTGFVIYQTAPISVPMRVKRWEDTTILVLGKNSKVLSTVESFLKDKLKSCNIIINNKKTLKDLKPEFIFKNKIFSIIVVSKNTIQLYDYQKNLIRSYPLNSLSVEELPVQFFKYFERLTPILIKRIKIPAIKVGFLFFNNNLKILTVTPWYFSVYNLNSTSPEMTSYLEDEKVIGISFEPPFVILNLKKGSEVTSRVYVISDEKLKIKTEYPYPITIVGKLGSKVLFLKNNNNQFELFTFAKGKEKPLKGLSIPKDVNFFTLRVFSLNSTSQSFVGFDQSGRLSLFKSDKNSYISLWRSPYSFISQVFPYPFNSKVSPVILSTFKKFVLFPEIRFPLASVIPELKIIPLNSGYSKIFVLGIRTNNIFFKSITPSVDGVITGLTFYKGSIYFSVLRGEFPQNCETLIFKAKIY